jgi:protoheme IX farnesyltransferase
LFYIFVYTLLLKRRSPANIVIGGAAGCFPVLVGWAAVTGTVSPAAVVLFAVIFLWTPPHFWALAMKFRKDYAAANVPMLPVVASPAAVARKILWYSYAMVAATLVLVPYAGWIYGVLAAALGAWFLVEAHGLDARVRAGQATESTTENAPESTTESTMENARENAPSPAPMRLFHLSIAYLTLLFAAVAVTALLPWGRW